ncbi:MAG: DUF1328 domain-containing protein [candidate division Zixibacteria bacterium]|jgi:uncharacterized membrane protein YtjA (UPF0391 family)|nr:DUF1328 domain-containing protein [candidate division Zixibacteria bacterium]
MVSWAVLLFMFSIASAVIGFGGVIEGVSGIFKALFIILLMAALGVFIAGMIYRTPKK